MDRYCEEQIAPLRDRLTGALIGLARATENNEHLLTDQTHLLFLQGLCVLDSCAAADEFEQLLARIETEKRRLVGNCFTCTNPCGRTADYDIARLWAAEAEDRRLRTRILLVSREVAKLALPAWIPGHQEDAVDRFLRKALFTAGQENWLGQWLMPVLQEGEALRQQFAVPQK